MRRIVMFSGGVVSWATAKRVAERYGTDGLTLLFADTNMEDADLYRFLEESAANVGGQLVRIADGRTPWQVFHDVRLLGNNMKDPCSRILKRELLDLWVREHCDPGDTEIYLGYSWEEMHRLDQSRPYWIPWSMSAPLCEPPEIGRAEAMAWLEREGIEFPRLYRMGFQHNNCGGFCIKAGQAQFEHLYRVMPDRFRFHEQQEQEIRAYLNADVSILRDRIGGDVKPLTLTTFRERIDRQPTFFDSDDWGGCGCMVGFDEMAA